MANFNLAMERWFHSNEANQQLRQLNCWRALEQRGFSETELLGIFRRLYCKEMWLLIKGEEISHQRVGEFLFTSLILGRFASLVIGLQMTLNIECSGLICARTLNLINLIESDMLLKMLSKYDPECFDVFQQLQH